MCKYRIKISHFALESRLDQSVFVMSPVICSVCNKSYSLTRNLKRHQIAKHTVCMPSSISLFDDNEKVSECFPSKKSTFIIVDIEGYQFGSGTFYVKEFAINVNHRIITNLTVRHNLEDWAKFDRRQRIAFEWLYRNLFQIRWDEGEIDYHTFVNVVIPYIKSSEEFQPVQGKNDPPLQYWTKGKEKCRILSELMGVSFYNLEDVGCPPIYKLSSVPTSCIFHATNEHCALKKVVAFGRYVYQKLQTRRRNPVYKEIPINCLEAAFNTHMSEVE